MKLALYFTRPRQVSRWAGACYTQFTAIPSGQFHTVTGTSQHHCSSSIVSVEAELPSSNIYPSFTTLRYATPRSTGQGSPCSQYRQQDAHQPPAIQLTASTRLITPNLLPPLQPSDLLAGSLALSSTGRNTPRCRKHGESSLRCLKYTTEGRRPGHVEAGRMLPTISAASSMSPA